MSDFKYDEKKGIVSIDGNNIYVSEVCVFNLTNNTFMVRNLKYNLMCFLMRKYLKVDHKSQLYIGNVLKKYKYLSLNEIKSCLDNLIGYVKNKKQKEDFIKISEYLKCMKEYNIVVE